MNPVALTAALVEFDSRNPTLVPGAPGEGRVAHFLGDLLDHWGFAVELQEVVPGRSNVIARIGRRATTPATATSTSAAAAATARVPSIMLNGHLDVVGVDGMIHPPFVAEQRDGRLYGRGSTDMKSGVAAMCVAAREAAQVGLDGEVVVACVIDEEYESLGTHALLQAGVRTDVAIVTEPTRLAICPAHRGFMWADLEIRGRAAHGSRYDLGVDAITHAAYLLTALDRIQREELTTRVHPLLGRASLHAAMVRGGTGYSTYPESCHVSLERRTLPGETAEIVEGELRRAIETLREQYPAADVSVQIHSVQSPSDVERDAPVVHVLESALQSLQQPVRIEGLSAWTDCAVLNAAGIPAVCFGPGDIALAHSAEEYVALDEIDEAARVLRQAVLEWCNGSSTASETAPATTSELRSRTV